MNMRIAHCAAVVYALQLFLISSVNAATLLVDQVGASSANGGYGDPVVQTFLPAQNNIAGVNVMVIGTAVLTDTVSVSLYSDLARTILIATDTIADHPRNTTALFRWDAAAVIPETTYYLEFLTGSLSIGASVSNSTDPYDRGSIIVGGGNLGFIYKDAQFSTYYDSGFSAVPLPAAAWLFISALAGLFVAKRRQLNA